MSDLHKTHVKKREILKLFSFHINACLVPILLNTVAFVCKEVPPVAIVLLGCDLACYKRI